MKLTLLVLATLSFLGFVQGVPLAAENAKRPFTIADDIGLSTFVGEGLRPDALFSPDGNYLAVYSKRGRLDINRPENSLRFYRTDDIEKALEHPDSPQPSPVWILSLSTNAEGPIIANWHWLPDSSGVAFLQRLAGGHYQLTLADIQKQSIEPLTSPSDWVETSANFVESAIFDVRDRSHYVYQAVDEGDRLAFQHKREAERSTASLVGTGRDLYELIFPDDPITSRLAGPKPHLWAVVGDNHFEIKVNGEPVVPDGELALSPDGRYLVMERPVPDVPKSWETLYPPFGSSGNGIHAGKGTASEYVRVDLQTGSVQSLTGAPIAADAGWRVGYFPSPSWSRDGQAVLLPGTFIKSDDGTPSRPCIAVVELRSLGTTCVEMLKGRTKTGKEDGYHTVQGAQFENGDRQRVIVDFNPPDTYWTVRETTRYQRANSRQWQLISHADGIPAYGHGHLEVAIKQTFTEPPLLVASRGSKSRVIWDPNPQLKDIEFPELSVFTWKDNKGREFKGGLFKPANYKPGQRYPLVIQTHGFGNYFFLPDGAGFGNFAAAELATAGIVVLQAGEDCPDGTEEGPCTASVYESAAKQLVADGLVDASKIGIIGFSRSCFYVMETLTTSSLHFKAASVIDGVMYDYLQFLTGLPGDDVMGALPIGEGLQQWMKRSPGFNLEKVNTPLLIRTGEGQSGLLYMWQPYAVLHQLKKPVDLIMLNTDEHAITNPAMRLVAQGGTIDWFRFWLQGYEDPDPAKAEQYKRWREMRKMQEANEKQLRSDSAENTTP